MCFKNENTPTVPLFHGNFPCNRFSQAQFYTLHHIPPSLIFLLLNIQPDWTLPDWSQLYFSTRLLPSIHKLYHPGTT